MSGFTGHRPGPRFKPTCFRISSSFAFRSLGLKQFIVSDANTFYIDTILEHYGVRECFDGIYTNPASVVEDAGSQRLTVAPHQPWETPHRCELCSLNLCKGGYRSLACVPECRLIMSRTLQGRCWRAFYPRQVPLDAFMWVTDTEIFMQPFCFPAPEWCWPGKAQDLRCSGHL